MKIKIVFLMRKKYLKEYSEKNKNTFNNKQCGDIC